MKKSNHVVLFRSLTALILAVLVFSALPAAPARAAASVTETFMNSTAPGWTLLGNASLTSGGVDPVGNGWLRLTPASNYQAGSAIYNNAFSSTDGVQITFQYATYGGTGADGFTFYLINGATASPTVGATGGSLGYSFNNDPASGGYQQPGVTNGYVGIGFDEYGNFSNSNYGTGGLGTIQTPGLTVRGPGSSTAFPFNAGDFPYLTHSAMTVSTGNRAGAKTARITILNNHITVDVDSGSGFVNYINNFAIGAVAPATFKMGFSSSTGGSNNYHEIRNLQVQGAQTSTVTVGSSLNPSNFGQSVTFTAAVTGGSGTPTGTVTFLNGATVLGTGTLNGAGQATFTTSTLATGSHPITAQYGGDSVYGASTSNTVNQVVNSSAYALTVSGTYTYNLGSSAMNIASNLTASSTPSGQTIDGATVLISSGMQTGDVLSVVGFASPTFGISWTYNSAAGKLIFSGTADIAYYQVLLDAMSFSTTSTNTTTSRTVTYTLGSALSFSPCGAAQNHYYQFVSNPGITWAAANTAASAMTYFGLQGYLVTVTCQQENDFVASKLAGQGWMGATDAGHDKVWKWATGPEAGTTFFYQNGYVSGGPNTCGGGSATTQPSGTYFNWASGEPNDYPNGCAGNEDYGHFYSSGTWNDYAGNNPAIAGYVVEFGGMPGDPSPALSGSVTVNVANASAASQKNLPTTGFAPGMITNLPTQSADKAYATYGDLWLEIPSQNVKMSIVGVPATTSGWDVSWLGNNAGWLNGTAFPTWNGNSVITGHVWNADNTPGMFVGIKNLSYGNKVLVHAWGSVYTYEVRTNFLVYYDASKVTKHFDSPWITLLTCENYNTILGKYAFHRAVQATLISITAEK